MTKRPAPKSIDDIALRAARQIANLPPASVYPGKEIQRQARIQALVAEALRQAKED